MKIYNDTKILSNNSRVFFLRHWVLSLDLFLVNLVIRVPYSLISKTYDEFVVPFLDEEEPIKKKAPKKKAPPKKAVKKK